MVISLRDEGAPQPPPSGHGWRLGCAGHFLLFLVACVTTCALVFRTTVREATAAGRTPSADGMGLLWPVFVPFVYLGLLVLWWVAARVAAALAQQRASRTQTKEP